MHTRVGGSWKNVTEAYTKIGGAWKAFFTSVTPLTVNYLVIAGGGGGGGSSGGGGGAGGYRTSAGQSGGGASAESALTLTAGTSYTVTVGGGGAGGGSGLNGSAGASSVFSTITTVGGGQGKGVNSTPSGFSGGSGGGSSIYGGSTGTSAGGAGTTGQGYKGADVEQQSGVYGGTGGGGGAGAEAATSTQSSLGSNGGAGVSSSITGSAVTRGGGGGGGEFGRTGGSGGGGNGAVDPSTAATAGSANTGGGGGGGNYRNVTSGASGGSGVVIIKYPDSYLINVGSGLSHRTVTSGGFNITSFTAGTGTVSFSEAVDSDYELIETVYLTSSQTSVTFDVSGLASDYQHLQIRATPLFSITNSSLVGRFNADGGSNYDYHRMNGNGSSVSSGAGTTKTNMVFHYNQDNNSTTEPAAVVIDILDPFETTKNKTVRSLGGTSSGGSKNQIWLGSSLWRSTAAVTSISLSVASGYDGWEAGSLRQYSRISIYGLKGS